MMGNVTDRLTRMAVSLHRMIRTLPGANTHTLQLTDSFQIGLKDPGAPVVHLDYTGTPSAVYNSLFVCCQRMMGILDAEAANENVRRFLKADVLLPLP